MSAQTALANWYLGTFLPAVLADYESQKGDSYLNIQAFVRDNFTRSPKGRTSKVADALNQRAETGNITTVKDISVFTRKLFTEFSGLTSHAMSWDIYSPTEQAPVKITHTLARNTDDAALKSGKLKREVFMPLANGKPMRAIKIGVSLWRRVFKLLNPSHKYVFDHADNERIAFFIYSAYFKYNMTTTSISREILIYLNESGADTKDPFNDAVTKFWKKQKQQVGELALLNQVEILVRDTLAQRRHLAYALDSNVIRWAVRDHQATKNNPKLARYLTKLIVASGFRVGPSYTSFNAEFGSAKMTEIITSVNDAILAFNANELVSTNKISMRAHLPKVCKEEHVAGKTDDMFEGNQDDVEMRKPPRKRQVTKYRERDVEPKGFAHDAKALKATSEEEPIVRMAKHMAKEGFPRLEVSDEAFDRAVAITEANDGPSPLLVALMKKKKRKENKRWLAVPPTSITTGVVMITTTNRICQNGHRYVEVDIHNKAAEGDNIDISVGVTGPNSCM